MRDLEDEAEALCETLREYVVQHRAVVTLTLEEIPADQWERQNGLPLAPLSKRESYGPHEIIYWKEGR
jgi:hypothetical protein